MDEAQEWLIEATKPKEKPKSKSVAQSIAMTNAQAEKMFAKNWEALKNLFRPAT